MVNIIARVEASWFIEEALKKFSVHRVYRNVDVRITEQLELR